MSPRANRIGCLTIVAVLVILLAAFASVGFNAKPEPEGQSIPII